MFETPRTWDTASGRSRWSLIALLVHLICVVVTSRVTRPPSPVVPLALPAPVVVLSPDPVVVPSADLPYMPTVDAAGLSGHPFPGAPLALSLARLDELREIRRPLRSSCVAPPGRSVRGGYYWRGKDGAGTGQPGRIDSVLVRVIATTDAGVPVSSI